MIVNIFHVSVSKSISNRNTLITSGQQKRISPLLDAEDIQNVTVATSPPLLYNKAKEAMVMNEILRELNSPLFFGIKPEELKPMLSCIGYHTIDEEKCNGCALLRRAALRREKGD